VSVAGLLLAAGAGRRMGGPKALLQLDGRTFVERGVSVLREAGCEPVLVVVGADVDDVRPFVVAEIVVAAEWAEGVGASLRAGLSALAARDVSSCVVTLVDQPLIASEAVRRLLGVAGEADAAVATYGGEPGHPVLLDRLVWSDVAALAVGDVGARAWLQAHPARVLQVPCDGLGSPSDVDTMVDLQLLRSGREPAEEQQRHQTQAGDRDR
jgi:CTP:molybdopterin cytidylyltransferase MocA